MSDPLAEMQDEPRATSGSWSKDSKSRPPDFKPGDKVQLKDFHGRWDFDLNVVSVYWAGVEPNQYWMVQVKMGDNANACIRAPHWHFMHAVKQVEVPMTPERLAYERCYVCHGQHGGLPCPQTVVTCVDPLAGLEDE